MKELAIGEEIRIRCVEGGGHCDVCTFGGALCADCHCSHKERVDGKSVHFEFVDTPDTPKIDLPTNMDLLTDEWICAYSSMFYTGSAVHYVREGMRIMKKMIEEKLNQKDKDNGK